MLKLEPHPNPKVITEYSPSPPADLSRYQENFPFGTRAVNHKLLFVPSKDREIGYLCFSSCANKILEYLTQNQLIS